VTALPPLPPTPLVSAVIPAHNAERFVGDAVVSVLNQTWPRMECIVVDDGSTDRTGDVVREAGGGRVRYIRQARSGVSIARNRGAAEAQGELIAFLDSDDVWLPEKTTQQVELLRSRSDVGLVLCDLFMVNAALRRPVPVRVDPSGRGLRKALLMEATGTGLSFTGMVRREVLAEVGGFDPAFSVSADVELALRIAARFPVVAVHRPLALYRIHDGQMHLDLHALEQDRRRLTDLVLPAGTGRQRDRRRAIANLYTRLFFYELKRGQAACAARSLGLAAVQLQPHRVLALSAWAATTRIRRRFGSPSTAADWDATRQLTKHR
jgi:glycosyltransferase involved in cell wall biosynthesis